MAICAAILARGISITLLMNGIVRLARGLTSIIKTSSFLIANCIFINPTVFNSNANFFV